MAFIKYFVSTFLVTMSVSVCFAQMVQLPKFEDVPYVFAGQSRATALKISFIPDPGGEMKGRLLAGGEKCLIDLELPVEIKEGKAVLTVKSPPPKSEQYAQYCLQSEAVVVLPKFDYKKSWAGFIGGNIAFSGPNGSAYASF